MTKTVDLLYDSLMSCASLARITEPSDAEACRATLLAIMAIAGRARQLCEPPAPKVPA